MTTQTRHRRRHGWALVGLVLVLGVTACSGGGDPQAFCDRLAAIEEEIEAGPDVEDDAAGFREMAARLRPLVVEAGEAAPGDVADDFEAVSTKVITFIDDAQAAADAELPALAASFWERDVTFDEAFEGVMEYARDECGLDLS